MKWTGGDLNPYLSGDVTRKIPFSFLCLRLVELHRIEGFFPNEF